MIKILPKVLYSFSLLRKEVSPLIAHPLAPAKEMCAICWISYFPQSSSEKALVSAEWKNRFRRGRDGAGRKKEWSFFETTGDAAAEERRAEE